MQAKGFHLLRWNKNVPLDFVGRHLLDPVESTNRDYIRRKVKEQLDRTSVTIVLIGGQTHESTWVAEEIQWSLDKGNGILGIKLDDAAKVPEALVECAAEIINWTPREFADAIERAVTSCARTTAIAAAGVGTGGSCGR
jgi:hypothetical protein